MSVRSRSGITSSKKEGELLSHHSEKWKQSQFKSSLSCFDQVIIWTKTSQEKTICFEENFKIWVHVHQDHTTTRNFTEKTVLLMFLQCQANPPATPKPPAWCFQIGWTKSPQLWDAWTLCMGWLHGTATAGWPAGGWWGGWRWHSSSVQPPTCWGSSSKLWVSSLQRLGFPPAKQAEKLITHLVRLPISPYNKSL